jgi:hypothetical protein
VPNYILRWMGSNVQTFGDQSGDEAANLMRNSMMGGVMTTSRLKGAMEGAIKLPETTISSVRAMGGQG